MRILKFGGTSVDGLDRLDNAATIAERAFQSAPVQVVVSALAGITNDLTAAIEGALEGRSDALDLPRLAHRHLECLPAASQDVKDSYRNHLDRTLDRLSRLLEGIALLRQCPVATRDEILAAGERLSVPLMAAALERRGLTTRTFDGSELIATDAHGAGEVDAEATRLRISRALAPRPRQEISVITGFIGSDHEGRTTTLGRGASDYSATLLAMALDADHVEIWTDTDGVLSADPRLVPEAYPLPHLTYREATDLACYGARVLHPQTLEPLATKGIPVRIRNSQRPDEPGTRVDGVDRDDPELRAVAFIEKVVRFEMRSSDRSRSHSLDLPTLAKLEQPPLLMSWEGPGRSFSLVVRAADADRAREAIDGRSLGRVQQEDLSLVAASGDTHTLLPLLRALSDGHVEIRDVGLPNPSRRWITVLVDRRSMSQAVRIAHDNLVLCRRSAHVRLRQASVS